MAQDPNVVSAGQVVTIIIYLLGLAVITAYNRIMNNNTKATMTQQVKDSHAQLSNQVESKIAPAAEAAATSSRNTESVVLRMMETTATQTALYQTIIHDLREDRRATEQRLAEVESRAQVLYDRIDSYKTELNTLLEDNKRKTQASTERDGRIAKLEDQSKTLDQRLTDTKSKLEEKQQELEAARYALGTAQTELETARVQLEEARTELKKAYEALADAERRATIASANLEAERGKVAALQQQVATQQRHIDELETKVQELQAQLDKQKTAQTQDQAGNSPPIDVLMSGSGSPPTAVVQGD